MRIDSLRKIPQADNFLDPILCIIVVLCVSSPATVDDRLRARKQIVVTVIEQNSAAIFRFWLQQQQRDVRFSRYTSDA